MNRPDVFDAAWLIVGVMIGFGVGGLLGLYIW